MKKTKLTRSLLAACSIVALSAVMYGCAHTDSGPSQEELDAANAATAAAAAEAKANADAAAAAAAEAKANADAAAAAEADAAAAALAQAAAEADAAAAALAQADAEAAAAAAAQAQADAEAAAAAAAQAQADAETQAAADAAAAAAATDAEAKAKAAEEAAADALAKTELAEKNKDLGSLFKGLHKMIEDPETAGEMIASPFTGVADPIIEAAHGAMADIFAPSAGDAADMPSIGSDAAFGGGTRMALPALNGWTGTDELAVNAPAGITDHINVYTDIDIGTELTFAMLFPQQRPTATGGVEAHPMAHHYDSANGVVTAPGLNVHQSLISAMMEDEDGETADIFQTGSGTKTHGNLHLFSEVISFPGTFGGATGIYRCLESGTENNCTSSGTIVGTSLSGEADDGAVEDDGAWTFNVDSGQTVEVADGNYAYFGWWLRIDAAGAWDVDVFHGSSTLVAVTVPVGTTGKATYNGSAAGKAVINPQLPGENLDGGAFTADATLTADFQARDSLTGNSESGMISGTIDNFMIDGEAREWSVALESALIQSTPQTPDDDFSGRTTWTIGKTGSPGTNRGNWSGDLWHAASPTAVPGTVTGEFTAVYNNLVGRMEGAFAANKE